MARRKAKNPQPDLQVDPQNLQAERAVLGAILLDNEVMESVLGVGLTPQAFHDTGHRLIFEEMLALRQSGRPVDLLTLTDRLRSSGSLNKVSQNGSRGAAFIVRLAEDIPTAAGVQEYARIIQQHYRRRSEIEAAEARLDGLKRGTIPLPATEEAQEVSLSDAGNAVVFAQDHRAAARFCPPISKWFVFDGRRFKRDENLEIMHLADATVAGLYRRAAAAPGKKFREELAAHALSSESRPRLEAMIFLARHRLGIRLADLDADGMLLNCHNGTVDLRTGDLKSHAPEDLVTKLAGAPYDPRAKCPAWLDHLRLVFNGDLTLIDWLQRVVGYCLTGDTSEQVFFLLHGGGNNGKSVTVQTIARVLGEYSTSTRAETLLRKRQTAAINNDIAALVGSRLVTIGEGLRGRGLDEDLVKSLTGGDTITARFLHQEWFTFEPTFKILWSTNHLPRIGDTTDSIWRRVRLIPFKVQIPPEIRDPHMEDHLREEFPGILAWAVEGCLRWQEKGLEPPDAVIDAVGDYRVGEDPLTEFIEERTVAGPDFKVGATDFFKEYKGFCESTGTRPLSQKNFGQLLRERGLEKIRLAKGLVYQGIGLRNRE